MNSLSPTAMSDIVVKHYPTEESQMEALRASGSVLLRWGDAEKDIGRSVVFLAGPDADLITGCTLSVDGGTAML